MFLYIQNYKASLHLSRYPLFSLPKPLSAFMYILSLFSFLSPPLIGQAWMPAAPGTLVWFFSSSFFHKAWMWKREWNIWWGWAPIIKLKSPSLSCISRSLFKKHSELLVFYMNFGALQCYWEQNTFVRSSLSYKCTACILSFRHTLTHTHI